MSAHAVRHAVALMEAAPGRGCYLIEDQLGEWIATLDLDVKGQVLAVIGEASGGGRELVYWFRAKAVLLKEG